MIKIIPSLLFITTLLEADTNPYDNPLTKENKELYSEFRRFAREIFRANLKRKRKFRLKGKETSCKNRCNETRSRTFYCHCDVNCQLYGDCCYDIWKSKICNKTDTVKQSEQNKWKCVSDLHRMSSTVVKLYWNDYPGNYPRIKGHMMISSCPNVSPNLESNCAHPDPNDTLGKIPVEGKHNHTYRNKYCALCNGNSPESIKYWRYELLCSPRNISEQRNETSRLHNCLTDENTTCRRENREYLKNNCTWYYAPPEGHSKDYTICSPVETCPQTPVINITAFEHHELTLKCQAYMRVVFHNGTYYKNFHCAKCHGIDPVQLERPPMIGFTLTLSMFFEIPQPTVRRHIGAHAASNETNTTGLQNNGSTFANSKSKILPGEEYLTLVGFLVSIVSLVFLLILYSKVNSLRTTPGKIIIGLSISIIAYQVLLFTGQTLTENAVACSVTAIFLHLAVLFSFAWMSVMSFDVWKTFGKNGKISVAKKDSTFLFYVLYVVINPLVIVVTAIVVDHTGLMSVYWRNKEIDPLLTPCWIIKPLSHYLFFVIPVGLSLCLNIIALIWTIIGITSAQNKSKRLQACKKNKNYLMRNFKMWIKLSIVMGVTWILGVAIGLSSVIRYLYVALNSFQGFFIFLAFVTNKRVLEKYRSSRPSQTTQTSW